MDVLEDERCRLVPCAGFDEHADRLKEAVAVGSGRLGLETQQDREVPRDDDGFVLADEPFHQLAELVRRHCEVVAVVDACQLLHLHREGAVGAALAIREAAAAHHPAAPGRDPVRELGRQP